MCTATVYRTDDFYFGRNLDLGSWQGERIVITPRSYPFRFLYEGEAEPHSAIIGMAVVMNDYPLYFDAANESGLAIAGLNFPGNAHFNKPVKGKRNVAVYEFIPWLLSKAETVEDARRILSDANLTDDEFAPGIKAATLHWMVSDQNSSITVEQTERGLTVYDNMPEVLTNNPEFPLQLFNLNNYRGLSPYDGENTFSDKLSMDIYCKGLGAIGLPGDLSSMSRFVKCAFTRLNSVSGKGELESVSQFFHILGSVDQQRGAVIFGDGEYEITVYSSCINCSKGIYYYKTYDNSRINAVDMKKADLTSDTLIEYPLIMKQDICYQN